jgi:hypothetical protein
MGSFTRSAPRPRSVEEFIENAGKTVVDTDTETNTSINTSPNIIVQKTKKSSPKRDKPWEAFRKKETARNIFNLRINNYYLAILRHLAQQDEDVSMQGIVKEILLPELERRAGIDPNFDLKARTANE